MHLYDESSSRGETQPPNPRVPTAALTHALAEIEARRARQAFEQAGTLTLAEALQASGVEATPDEVAEEVRRGREADAEEAAKQERRRRLRLILRAELASALLCGLTLLSLSRTVYDAQWQASHQRDEVRNTLRMTRGPHPSVQIHVLPLGFQPVLFPEAAAHRGTRFTSPMYPLSALPDGYDIHHDDDIDDDGHVSPSGAPFMPFMPTFPAYFEFRDARPSVHERVSVFYNGLRYDRGWIRASDVPNVLGGRPFLYYPEPVDDPQDNHAGLVPLTLAGQAIAEAHFDTRYAGNTGYNFMAFKAGRPLSLDEHAWEKF